MSKFDTTKNKFSKLWERSFKNENQRTLQNDTDKLIINNFDQINRRDNIFQGFIDLSSGWSSPNGHVLDNNGNPTQLLKTWEVNIGRMHDKFLQNLRKQIVFRFGGGSISSGKTIDPTVSYRSNIVVNTEDTGTADIKRVIVHAGIHFQTNIDKIGDLQVKFLLHFVIKDTYQ